MTYPTRWAAIVEFPPGTTEDEIQSELDDISRAITSALTNAHLRGIYEEDYV